MRKRMLTEGELAEVAKKCRQKAGVSKAEAARRLGVNRSSIHEAEEDAPASLTKLRIRMIEAFSEREVKGPFFMVKGPSASV